MVITPLPGDTITYSIFNDPLTDFDDFTIDPVTGVLSFVTGSGDFETPTDNGNDNVYEVIVRATDAGLLYDEQVLSITVTDVNEAPYFVTVDGDLTRLENFLGGLGKRGERVE